MNQMTVQHEPVETETRKIAKKLMTLKLGDKLVFDPPLTESQQDWVFRIFRAESKDEMQFYCTRTEDPTLRGLKKFFANHLLHTMTRTR